MKKSCQRLVSLLLVLSLVVGLFIGTPSASAVEYNLTRLIERLTVKQGAVSYPELEEQCNYINGLLTTEDTIQNLFYKLTDVVLDFAGMNTLKLSDVIGRVEIRFNAERPNGGYYELYDTKTQSWYHTYFGGSPYALPDEEHHPAGWSPAVEANCPGAPEISSSSNRWEAFNGNTMNVLLSSGKAVTTYNRDALNATVTALRAGSGSSSYTYSLAPFGSDLVGIRRVANSGRNEWQFLCNSSGIPFLAAKDTASSVVNQQFNYNQMVTVEKPTIVDGDVTINENDVKVENAVDIDNSSTTTNQTENYNQIINNDDRTFQFVTHNDNSTNIDDMTYYGQYIEDMYYDFSTHSYYVDASTNTYNIDNRTYETNYYTWNITYNISNTYVTYIGSNDAWEQEAYVYYYELPDGRSSADMTVDEVAAMSFQFYDCMNYQRSATDGALQALYHFDGDLKDSGYFSDKTSFTWNAGASITYMDSSAFAGALYLDELDHDFSIGLSSSIYAGQDFTIQFRYYQASQPDTQDNLENYISLGDTKLVSWDERHLMNDSLLLPIGNWCELAFIRQSSNLYIYINGVCVSTVSPYWADSASGSTIGFHFGSTSRAYSMVDELRVLNFALTKGGANYTPTAVPYDTNLVLTLPGSGSVTDSYWEISAPGNLLTDSNLSIGASSYADYSEYSTDYVHIPVENRWSFFNGSGKFSLVEGESSLTLKDVAPDTPNEIGSFCGLIYNLGTSSTGGHFDLSVGYTRTFSVLDSAGNVYSLTYTAGSGIWGGSTVLASASFDWGTLSVITVTVLKSADEYYYALAITPAAGASIDIVATSLVEGSTPALSGEKVTMQYDLASLQPNTAAVHTDIPIRGYTVGGVRPTFPAKGDVWFMVTSGRVSNVQVYNGSAWEASNARYWTGSRWIPIYAFDIYTLEDCWDVSDTDDVVSQITNESDFWNWWKSQWHDFRSWLSATFTGSGGEAPPSESPSPSPGASPSPGVPLEPVVPGITHHELAPYMSIVRENAEAWTSSDWENSITITMEHGDMWYSTSMDARNIFVCDFTQLLGDDYSDSMPPSFSLNISGMPVREENQWDHASLFLYEDDKSFYSIGKKSHIDGYAFVRHDPIGSDYCYESSLGGTFYNNVTDATFYFQGCSIAPDGVTPMPCYHVWARAAGESDGTWTDYGVVFLADYNAPDSLSSSCIGSSSFHAISPSKAAFACWAYEERGKQVTFSNLRVSNVVGLDPDSFIAQTPVTPFFVTVSDVEELDKGSFWDILMGLKTGIWQLITNSFNVVTGGVTGFLGSIIYDIPAFFSSFKGEDGVFGFQEGAEVNVWD